MPPRKRSQKPKKSDKGKSRKRKKNGGPVIRNESAFEARVRLARTSSKVSGSKGSGVKHPRKLAAEKREMREVIKKKLSKIRRHNLKNSRHILVVNRIEEILSGARNEALTEADLTRLRKVLGELKRPA